MLPQQYAISLLTTNYIAVYPGSSNHYIDVIQDPRFEDFEIQYLHQNPWAHLGMGTALVNTKTDGDLSPYLQLKNIDPRWLKAIGYKGAADEVAKEKDTKKRTGTNGTL